MALSYSVKLLRTRDEIRVCNTRMTSSLYVSKIANCAGKYDKSRDQSRICRRSYIPAYLGQVRFACLAYWTENVTLNGDNSTNTSTRSFTYDIITQGIKKAYLTLIDPGSIAGSHFTK